jgi:NAD+ kinase
VTGREVLLVAHTGRDAVRAAAAVVADRLTAAGLGVRVLTDEAAELQLPNATVHGDETAADVEVVLVLGGDGTLLRAAEVARPHCAPVLGINLGHVGFLAEAEREAVDATVAGVVACRYDVEDRMTIDVTVRTDSDVTAVGWALNEASVEKCSRERMIDLLIEVDGRPLSRWGADGVVLATPTGSTAYAFSAGGPIVWPNVEALLMVPISAHALFARPLVVGPDSVLAVEVASESATPAVVWCDGRRRLDAPPGARVEVRRGSRPVRLARLHRRPFTDRLVAKFALPVHGWRGTAP